MPLDVTGVQETMAPVRTIGHFLCTFQRNDYLGISQAKLTLVQLQGCDNHTLNSGILSTGTKPTKPTEPYDRQCISNTVCVHVQPDGNTWPCAGVFGVTFAIPRIRSWSTRQSMVQLQRPTLYL